MCGPLRFLGALPLEFEAKEAAIACVNPVPHVVLVAAV